MAAVQTVIGEIMDLMGALSGVKAAPDYPPEDMNSFPFIVAYEGPGMWMWGTAGGTYGEKKALLSIIVELHVARQNLPNDAQRASYYSDAIPNAIMKGIRTDFLNNSIDAIQQIDTTGLIALKWGETDTLGYRFTIQGIKIRSDIA